MAETWLVEPRDTLIVRDARLATDGASMRSLSFPWPSSMTGLARSCVGTDERGCFVLSRKEAKDLEAIEVAGPWLAILTQEGEVETLCLPAPEDCLWHLGSNEGRLERRRLSPRTPEEDELADLPDGLRLLVAKEAPEQKPVAAPAFWRWDELKTWLTAPPLYSEHELARFGLPALMREERVHVCIDEDTECADDGMLFSTESLRFADEKRRLALVFRCRDQRLRPGGVHLGGERRISWLREGPEEQLLPSRPSGIAPRERLVRLILITPAIFDLGFRPGPIEGGTLVAAAVGRPQIISGWDFAAKGPKPCRRAAPAGSVYWFELDQGVDADAWIDRHWMHCISDNEQDRRDGFGLCLVGVG